MAGVLAVRINKAAAKYITELEAFHFTTTVSKEPTHTYLFEMAPPSKLGVATSSLLRLVKEEASYHKEMEQQQSRIKKWEANTEDDNAEYHLKQEVCAIILSGLIQLTLYSVKDWRRPRTSFPRSEKRSPKLLKTLRSSL
jgi:hypothetical protein